MACGCQGKPKVAMTSAAATALQSSGRPKYAVTTPDGQTNVHELYVDAKTEARRTGGTLTEVR